jgi:preprotein translocase subunit SecG
MRSRLRPRRVHERITNAMSFLFTILTLLFFVTALALVLIILVQRPQGGGLSGAFGGGGGTDTAFGGRTGDALTVATITAFGIYLLLAIGLNITGNIIRSTPVEPVSETAPATDPLADPAAGLDLAPPAGDATAPAPSTADPAPVAPAETPAPVPAGAPIDTPAADPAAPSTGG